MATQVRVKTIDNNPSTSIFFLDGALETLKVNVIGGKALVNTLLAESWRIEYNLGFVRDVERLAHLLDIFCLRGEV